MTPYETIRVTGGMLRDGESERSKCPWCQGGGTGEESFIITREGNSLKFICHRATCNNTSSGVMSVTGSPTSMADYRKKPRSNEYVKATRMLTPSVRTYLYDSFGFTTAMLDEYRIKQDEEGKVVIPLFNADGVQQGHEVKKGNTYLSGPKSLLYHGNTSDGLAWYLGKPQYSAPVAPTTPQLMDFYNTSVVLVEDAFSAMKANAFMNSVALLGTNLSTERAHAIALKEFDRVYIALDADASAKALRMAKRLRGILPNLRVILLKKDIKNMGWDSIAQLFSIHHRRV